ncbi:hypothetical protein HJ077_22280 [Vibrio parahaemolyticus]|nr:hypothetical protein [Vibrio parahaemolyticus]
MNNSENFKLLWWGILLIVLGIYLYGRYPLLIEGNPNYFDAVVFLVWVAVALSPIFKDMKLFGLHLKQDIEQLKKDLNHQLSLMKVELQSSIEVSSSNSNHVHIGSNPMIPASDSELPDIEKHIAETLKKYGLSDKVSGSTASLVGENVQRSNVELFKVRYSFEKLLNNYARLNGIDPRRSPITKTIRNLANQEIISSELAGSVLEIMAICNYAIHGEEISEKQRKLVEKSAYGLYEALKQSLKSYA